MPKGRYSQLQGKLCDAVNQVAEEPKTAYAFPELRDNGSLEKTFSIEKRRFLYGLKAIAARSSLIAGNGKEIVHLMQ